MTKKARKRRGTVRAFLRTVAASCYDLSRYRTIRTARLRAAIRYFATFVILMSLLAAVMITPAAGDVVASFRDDVVAQLPEGASFSIKDGMLTSSLSEPVEYETDEMIVRFDQSLVGLSLPDDAAEGMTVTIGRDAFFFDDGAELRQAYPFEGMEDIDMTRQNMLDWLRSNGRLVIALTVVAFAIGNLIAMTVGSILFVLSAAFLTTAVMRMRGSRLGHRAWIAVGLHAVTLPILADTFFDILIGPTPLVFAGLFILVMVAVATDELMNPVTPPQTS